MASWSFPHLYNPGLLLGTTTTANTLVTHVSKRHWDPWCTGKVCVLPSRDMSNLADLARLTRDTA
jgi:hypothetical protein